MQKNDHLAANSNTYCGNPVEIVKMKLKKINPQTYRSSEMTDCNKTMKGINERIGLLIIVNDTIRGL